MNLSDAVKNLALSIVNSMAQIASQQLAQMATSSLIGSSGGIGGLLGSVFAADGGQVRGAGTTTSDSIPAMLSDQEYVVRASVVQQPGALAFFMTTTATVWQRLKAGSPCSSCHWRTGGHPGAEYAGSGFRP
jgi:hypothetical protein